MNKFKSGWQENLVFVVDTLSLVFTYVLAYFIRFDGFPEEQYLKIMVKTLPLIFIIRKTVFIYFKLHKSIWQYASITDLIQILKGVTISSISILASMAVFNSGCPRSIFIIDWLLLIIVLSGTRFIIRLTRPLRRERRGKKLNKRRVLIVGAGDAGEMISREMIYGRRGDFEVLGFVDDNPAKKGRKIHGIPVLGRVVDISSLVIKKNIHEIIIAIPSLNAEQTRNIVEQCIKSKAKYRIAPNISEIINGTVQVKELREVQLEDILGRQEVILNRERMGSYITGKTVFISGAGGSIGSELCRQVARLNPGKLVLFEKAENPLFYIDMELGQFFKGLKKVAVVGDICDRIRVEEVFLKHKPHIVFHAAAYKHVPLMETNGMEAIKNNVFGTKILAEEAADAGVEKFIMLSTDKAVEPTSVMGVSKRIAELYITSLADKSTTKFMAVRFGNVLGSEGSVVPVFKKMIEKGGPITITHPDITRYFMTIPEAAGLVMEAGFMGQGAEIFILEMGKQIKILDLARDMIRLSGLELDNDIKIVFTSLRPGEKMYEALFGEDEKLLKTSHEKIMMVESNKENRENIIKDLDALEQIVAIDDRYSLLGQLKKMVPNYNPNQQLPQKTKLPEGRKLSNKKIGILIADDEKIVQEVLSKFLDGRGYNTLLASNGREALNIIDKSEVRLAFIDVRMPGFIDGLQILKRIKKIRKNIEVIIMTGYRTEKARRKSRDLGAYAYLEKPFDLADIKMNVEAALNKQECLI